MLLNSHRRLYKATPMNIHTQQVINTLCLDEHDQLPLADIIHALACEDDLPAVYQHYPRLAEKLSAQVAETLKLALTGQNAAARRDMQLALFILYQSHLAEPLSAQSRNQFDPLLIQLRQTLESSWLENEINAAAIPLPDLCVENMVAELTALWSAHPTAHHPLFDFLASEANETQINYFFKSDSALNLLFFDLVAMTLVGSFPETRAEISHNLWDEIGQGSNEFTHVNLYKNLLERRGIALPDDHFTHLYEWQGLAGYNLFMAAGVTRQHYYKLTGMMAMTELLDPSQYEKLVVGCKRNGLSDRDIHYYSEHISVDVAHADGWLNNVIVPVCARHPAAMAEIYNGAILRLQTCQHYYDYLLAKLRSLSAHTASEVALSGTAAR